MKHVLLITVFFFLSFLYTQKSYSQGFNAGLKLGANLSQVDGDDLGGYKKIGFTGGLFITYSLDKRNIIQFEMLYSPKGSKSSLNTKAESYEHYEMKLHYIDIPIFYSFAIIKPLRIEAGLVPGILIKSEESRAGDTGIAGEFKKIDLSGLLGVNFRFTESLSITGRFLYSFINIRKNPENSMKSLFGSGQFNNVVSLTLNYHF